MTASLDQAIAQALQVLSALLVFVFAFVSYSTTKYRELQATTLGPESDIEAIKAAIYKNRHVKKDLLLSAIPVVPLLMLLSPLLGRVLTHWSWWNSVRTGLVLVYLFLLSLLVLIAYAIWKICKELDTLAKRLRAG